MMGKCVVEPAKRRDFGHGYLFFFGIGFEVLVLGGDGFCAMEVDMEVATEVSEVREGGGTCCSTIGCTGKTGYWDGARTGIDLVEYCE